jgi:cytochrome P450
MTTVMSSPKMLPGPSPVPIIGARGNEFQFARDPIVYMRRAYRAYGTIVGGVRGNPVWLFAFGPEYNHLLLSRPEQFYSFFLSIPAKAQSPLHHLTSGLLNMNGVQHARDRRLMLPLFHKQAIARYRDTMVTLTEAMLNRWSVGQPIDIMREMQQLTLAIVGKTLFGIDVYNTPGSLMQLLRRWLQLFTAPATNVAPIDLPGMPYRQLLACSSQLEQALQALIVQKRAEVAESSDVLAMLIQARDEDGAQLSDAELLGHANLLFLAGHETSANALTWTLFLLAQHPNILAELRDELVGVLRGAAPTVEQLAQLPLLDRVVHESLRVLPPAVYGVRYGVTPFTLGPYELPARSTVIFSPFITHHMPELYAEPDRFVPDRWCDIAPSPYAYLPFGAGPRRCIGATFAEMEIKLVLAMVLQYASLALRPRARIDYQVRITLTPRRGLPMIVRPLSDVLVRQAISGTIRDLVAI